MPIKVGDRLPEAKFRVMTSEGPAWKTTDEIFKGKKVALFAVPGAYTNTCHKMHVPSIQQNADAIKAKGVNTIAVTSVNDVFVMDAWKKATAADKVDFLADGNGEFAKAIDGAPAGLQRFAFELDGAPPGVPYKGASIALTAVAGNAAIEVVTRLD